MDTIVNTMTTQSHHTVVMPISISIQQPSSTGERDAHSDKNNEFTETLDKLYASPHLLQITATDNSTITPSSAYHDSDKSSSSHSHHNSFVDASFEFNSASTVTNFLINIAVQRCHSSYYQRFWTGMLVGFFIVLGGIIVLTVTGGLDPAFRVLYPAVVKILAGSVFPVALIFIMFVGGDLMTGNCMFCAMAVMHGNISIRQAAAGLTYSFFTNLAWCLVFDQLLAVQTNLFVSSSYLSQVYANAHGHLNQPFVVVLLKAIGANALVCIGVFMGHTSRSALGKIVLIWVPIFVFVAIGYEHVIANMSFIPIALMYGYSEFTVSDYIVRNILPALIGNFIGGGILMGCTCVYLYAWESRVHRTMSAWCRFNFIPTRTMSEEWKEFKHQLMHSIPINAKQQQQQQQQQQQYQPQLSFYGNNGGHNSNGGRSHSYDDSSDLLEKEVSKQSSKAQ